MTPAFSVRTTSRFDRLFKSLVKHHPELTKHYAEALRILKTDPYNRSRAYDIRKLEGVKPGGKVNTGSGLAGGVFAMTLKEKKSYYTIAVSDEKTPTHSTHSNSKNFAFRLNDLELLAWYFNKTYSEATEEVLKTYMEKKKEVLKKAREMWEGRE